MVLRLVFLSLSFLALVFGRVARADSGLELPYDYLNQQRLAAGMTSLARNQQLETAAQGHADYLLRNGIAGHYQASGSAGFTGVTPVERAIGAGYPSRYVLENVSSGQDDGQSSVDGLMSAIYHRIGFLNFTIDEIGMGAAAGDSPRYSYSMGNSALAAACAAGQSVTTGSYYTAVCQPDIMIAASVYEGALAGIRQANPARVVWPADGGTGLPPAFYDETPDPLPDYAVSGYPLSLNFNEAKTGPVELLDMGLVRTVDGAEVGPARLMDAGSDPNAIFSALDFTLFPLVRLDWNTRYRAEADYLVDNERHFLRWHFTTRHPGVEYFSLRGDGDGVTVGSGSSFAVYFPPTHANDTLTGAFSWSYPFSMSLDIEVIDNNTFRLLASGLPGDRAEVTAGARSFYVSIDNSLPLAETEDSNVATAGCPGGVGLASFSPVSGLLELPVVRVEGAGFYRAVMRLADGMEFELTEAVAVNEAEACAAATFAGGVLDIPVVKVASGREPAVGYRAMMAFLPATTSRFMLTSVALE